MLIIATAGHIDHGKTALVRALTGVETDRLPEERSRGISIDLGFAYWEAEAGQLIAMVDVPGHQRFIRNMLAGVAAIHFAIVVVAVDDGPMPQTIEHLQILNYLGVRRGVVVLSKSDLAGSARIEEVRCAMSALLDGTSLQGAPSLPVSARTGEGIAELKSLLAHSAREHEQGRTGASAAAGRRARFAIDRVFTVRGAGTVATGTVYDGEIHSEDRLELLRSGDAIRVRGIQVHGGALPAVGSGERAALNLSGAPSTLARGDWLTDPALAAGGQLLEVQLSLLGSAPPLRHASLARLHLGPSELVCRVLLPGLPELAPGRSSPVRLKLDQAIPAVNGDRFVLRDSSGMRSLAGGFVVNPWPLNARRPSLQDEFAALATGGATVALRLLLSARDVAGVELKRFQRVFNLTEVASAAALRDCDAVVFGKSVPTVLGRGTTETVVAAAAGALASDTRSAVPVAELRQSVAPGLALDAFEALLRGHAERLGISLAGGAVMLRERRDLLRSDDLAIWQQVRPLLAQAGLHPLDLATFARHCDVPVARLRAVLQAQAREKELFQLRPERYIVRALVAQLATAAAKTASEQPDGRFTAGEYRDTVGTGRTLAIHVLEMLDLAGITQRIGDERSILRAPEAVFGRTEPFKVDADDRQPDRSPPRARYR